MLTNKCPSGANRGIGKPFMCFAMERAMSLLARRLGLDPAELRQRNYVGADEMPYTTPTGSQYDSGDYPATLRAALERFGYGDRRREQAAARASGRLLGLGIATSVEPAGTNLASYEIITGRRAASGSAEAAMVRVEPDGHGSRRAGRSTERSGLRDRRRPDRRRRAGAEPGAGLGRAGLRLDDDAVAVPVRQLLQQVRGDRHRGGGGRGPPGARQAPASGRASGWRSRRPTSSCADGACASGGPATAA